MYFDVAANEFLETSDGAAKLCFAGADRELSWQELKDLSDRICQRLEEIKTPEGAPVIVYGEKEVLFLAAILSCYRKKIPFVPVEPSLPKKRIESIISQTKSEAIIVCGDYPQAPRLSVSITSALTISGKTSFQARYPDIAYVLFTSGTSGEPKGVLVTRDNIISFTKWFCKSLPVDRNTIFINQASFLFDISLADLVGCLQLGASAIFNTSAQIQNGEFFSRIKKVRGSYWNSTPSFLSFCWTNKDLNEQNFPGIKTFTLSGEELSPTLVTELAKRFPNATIINAYGPTEACIFSSCIAIGKEMLSDHSLPISYFPSHDLAIENNELIISGPQVAQGYLGGEKFHQRFASGDLVEEKNGLLFYKGRKDYQVKFNGYRIELNEIKSLLENRTDVSQAECIPLIVDKKIKRLVAFVQLKYPDADPADIREYLALHLPAYMIPSEIIPVKEFPHTSSFKTDRKKLMESYLNL